MSFHGKLLSNEQVVEDFDLVPGSTLDATVKLLGGKIHGSINRAGKVKAQTPKVNIDYSGYEHDTKTSFFFLRWHHKKNQKRRQAVPDVANNMHNVLLSKSSQVNVDVDPTQISQLPLHEQCNSKYSVEHRVQR